MFLHKAQFLITVFNLSIGTPVVLTISVLKFEQVYSTTCRGV